MKNKLLLSIPELKWAGINTYGCKAVISVEERQNETTLRPRSPVESIVALRDGVISKVTVFRGNPLCREGDVVKEGQTLVSAYTDCGLSLIAQQAKAEIFAFTVRSQNARMLLKTSKKDINNAPRIRYSLIIGKKLIKLFKDSRNQASSCGKIYKDYQLTLPGGCRLPVSLIKEEIYFYSDGTVVDTESGCDDAALLTEEYVESQMISGEILKSNYKPQSVNNTIILQCVLFCNEFIGVVKPEECLPPYDERN